MRCLAGKWDHLANTSGHAVRPTTIGLGVEGEFALQHVVDLARSVTMHHRWAATRLHPQVHREQRAAGFGATGQHRDLVGSHVQTTQWARIDR